MKTILDDYIYYTVMITVEVMWEFIMETRKMYAGIDAIQNETTVSAKSILSMMSLDFNQPITIRVFRGDLTDEEEHKIDVMLLPIEIQKPEPKKL